MEGRRLGAFTIDRELGAGGMGTVYAATVAEGAEGVGGAAGLAEGTAVALKVVHRHLLETPEFLERFLREVQLGQAIRHRNVVRTLGCDADGDTRFLVMELVDGQDLRAVLRELDSLPEELCRHVAREIATGLAAIHAAGVVHRDLKPENVLITPDHVVKIMDLGVARLVDEQMRLSQSGAFVGSVEYAAPEQFKGGAVDGRTDLHALGVLLYELSSGTHPYRGGGFHEAMQRVCEQTPRPLGELNPQTSAYFEEVVHTLLVKDPRGRFASADRLLGVLKDGEESSWWRDRARELRETTRRPVRRIRIPRETAVYGRESDLEVLRERFRHAAAGDGQVVLIEGEAGIGKSRLVDELVAQLHAEGEDLDFLFGGYPPGGAASAAGAFTTAFHEHLGDDGAAGHLARTPLLVPAFEALLRGDAPPPGARSLDAHALATCFVHVVRGLAAERPTILWIDDLHFAPEEARALFAALAMAVPGHRVMLIGSMRPGLPTDWVAGITRHDHTTQMEVHRLGPKDLVRLLEDSFRSRHLAEDLSARIAVKSDGNPFFAFEIIRGLREGNFITRGPDGTWSSTRVIDDIEIPSSVLDLVNARISGLTEDERSLLEVAACVGHEFDPGLVGDVVGMARIPALRALGQIERRHRLVRASGRMMVFDHHQVLEALYDGLMEQLREEYHGAIGDTLEARNGAAGRDPASLDGALCLDLCEHFAKALQGPRAGHYLAAAQSYLEAGARHAHLSDLSERVLAMDGALDGTARVVAVLRLANALRVSGHVQQQLDWAHEAVRLAEGIEDAGRRQEAATALGGAFWRLRRFDDALEIQTRAGEIAREAGDRGALAGCLVNVGLTHWAAGRLEEARRWYDEGLAAARESGNRDYEAKALGNLCGVCVQQQLFDEAEGLIRQAREIHRERGDRAGEANATGNLGVVFAMQGRLVDALPCYELHVAITREIGHRPAEALACGNLGSALLSLGHVRRALAAYERQEALGREIGDVHHEGLGAAQVGVALSELGRDEDARRKLVHGLGLLGDGGPRGVPPWCMSALVEVELRAGRVDAARAALDERLALFRISGNTTGVALTLAAMTRLPGADVAAAEEAYPEGAPGMHGSARADAALLLYRATGKVAYLEEAKRLVDASLAAADDASRAAMRANLRTIREVVQAWRQHTGETDPHEPGDDDPRSTESVTRVV